MKVDWLLLLGSIAFLVFIVTLFVNNAFWSGFGLAMAIGALACIGASIGARLRRRR